MCSGPPLPVSAGNNPVCSINRLKQDISGTSDPDAGEGSLNISLSTLVHLGEGLTKPCPVCVGDTIAARRREERHVPGRRQQRQSL